MWTFHFLHVSSTDCFNNVVCGQERKLSEQWMQLQCIFLPTQHRLLSSAFGYKEYLKHLVICGLYLFCLSGIAQPYRIDLFEDYIYGTGLKHEVFRVYKYGKQPVEFLNLGLEKPTNVLIAHRYKQQDGKFNFFNKLYPDLELRLCWGELCKK